MQSENPELVKQPVQPDVFNQEMRATLKEGREACKTALKANKVQQQLVWRASDFLNFHLTLISL